MIPLPEAGHGVRMQDARCRVQDAGYMMQDARCKMQDAGCRIERAPGIRNPIAGT
jgi:hypothetical protein